MSTWHRQSSALKKFLLAVVALIASACLAYDVVRTSPRKATPVKKETVKREESAVFESGRATYSKAVIALLTTAALAVVVSVIVVDLRTSAIAAALKDTTKVDPVPMPAPRRYVLDMPPREENLGMSSMFWKFAVSLPVTVTVALIAIHAASAPLGEQRGTDKGTPSEREARDVKPVPSAPEGEHSANNRNQAHHFEKELLDTIKLLSRGEREIRQSARPKERGGQESGRATPVDSAKRPNPKEDGSDGAGKSDPVSRSNTPAESQDSRATASSQDSLTPQDQAMVAESILLPDNPTAGQQKTKPGETTAEGNGSIDQEENAQFGGEGNAPRSHERGECESSNHVTV
ncbi:hypothetical protein BESB_003890 [Besnoitia besnoiti]|uniref:Transmembrane protein n=1 Tax=Besnoitia besnoiti TaxID=94643 RepID=A0A2A9MHN5_BESBE|nr:hypothetical protein BESB_003890 [Besnoitia besnoiti]PFH38048.1 hypothetical protein BESB_003890 [Besnoitia besnoiti]